MKKKKGFTLIEILIAISILAILATIGMSTYSQAQMRGRDAKRKQDLRAVATALELFYQKNKRFPCAGWLNSSSAPTSWVSDGPVTGVPTCTGTNGPNDILTPNFINVLPKDPVNTGTQPWLDGHLVYGYRGWECAPQAYVLIAELENKNDPDRVELNNRTWCGTMQYFGASNSITSSRYKFIIAVP